MSVAVKALQMKHDTDPKEDIRRKVGDISGVTLMHNSILVATYERPKVTASGIHIPDSVLAEDRYQGKVGLVIAKGPLAFVDDKDTKFHGQNVEVGDWVYYRALDGYQMLVKEQHCRLLTDTQIRGKLAHPDTVY